MYTGKHAHDWTALHAQGAAAVQRAEAGLPWEQAGPRASTDQETWLISFIDVLTLLLTLFVLLLAYQKHDEARMPEREPPAAAAQAVLASLALPAAASGEQMSVLSAGMIPPPAQDVRSAAVNATQAAEPPDASATEVLVAQAESSPASPWLMGRAPAPGSGALMAAVQAHPLQWLNEFPVMASVPEPAAVGENRPEAQDDPEQRLLADLEQSALAGRVEVTVLPDAVNLEISDSILFTPASAALTAGGRRLLDELAATLKTLPYELSVEGHTDNVPIRTARYPSNWELAAARASTVTRHLIGQGIAAERVRAIGYADTRPRAANTTPEGRARNRRVSFILRLPAS